MSISPEAPTNESLAQYAIPPQVAYTPERPGAKSLHLPTGVNEEHISALRRDLSAELSDLALAYEVQIDTGDIVLAFDEAAQNAMRRPTPKSERKLSGVSVEYLYAIPDALTRDEVQEVWKAKSDPQAIGWVVLRVTDPEPKFTDDGRGAKIITPAVVSDTSQPEAQVSTSVDEFSEDPSTWGALALELATEREEKDKANDPASEPQASAAATSEKKSADNESGRGLDIVRSLASVFRYYVNPESQGGKTLVMVFPAHRAEATAEPVDHDATPAQVGQKVLQLV